MERSETNIFVTISGLPGSGKTALGQCLDNMSPGEIDPSFNEHFLNIHTIPMRWLLGQQGYDGSNTIAELQAFHKNLRDQGRANKVFDSLRQIKDGIVVIDSIRNIDDLNYMKQEFGALAIGLTVPLDVAKDRFMRDQDDDKHRHSFMIFGGDIDDKSLDAKERIIQARNLAWEHAIAEVGEDPHHYDCIEQAGVVIDARVSFGQVAVAAKGHIRKFIKTKLVERSQTASSSSVTPSLANAN